MTPNQSILQTVLANPDDPLPRLVYADWLEEQGDPRAEFIRVQCELARTAPSDPRWNELADREHELLGKHGRLWLEPRLSAQQIAADQPMLPLCGVANGFFYMRMDGRLVFSPTHGPHDPRIERDVRLQYAALFRASLKYPDLRLLIPPRPVGSSDCSYCGGTGNPFRSRADFDCHCGGLGWLPPSRMKAILSDIHGNLEALQAVLADAKQFDVQQYYCLGDIVGYGPNPVECIDLVMPFQLNMLGNFDQATMFDPDGYSPPAERSIFWTREQLNQAGPNPIVNERRWSFLARYPKSRRERDLMYVHGSARNPLNEYVFPEDIYNDRKMDRILALVERYCFQGHTHVPGVFTENNQFQSPEELDHVYRLDDRKTMINVGSVGQPRDGDWRACYVLFDDVSVRFRRVEYDVATTVRKIHDTPELENFLGDRLREGR
jgi:uncharacterized protein (TIGR02996 family)